MIDVLKRVSLFSQLNDEQLSSIAEIGIRKMFKAGTVLFREHENGSVFYVIISGSVKIFTTHQTGEEKIITVFSKDDAFGELSLIDGKPRSASAQTLEDTYLFTISGNHFIEVMKNNFEIAQGIMKELCQRLRDTNQHVHDLTFLNARTRVIKNLLTLANKNGKREGTKLIIKLALNYDELSKMAGVQKKDLMEVLRDLELRQIIEIGYNEFILDLSKLR